MKNKRKLQFFSSRLSIQRMVLAFSLFFASLSATAGLIIDITDSVEGALPIAIVPFSHRPLVGAEDIAAIIRSDLRRSGMFAPLATNQLPERPLLGENIRFQRWRGTGADKLIVGHIRKIDADRFEISFKMFDIFTQKQQLGSKYVVKRKNMRRVAHKISDLIYQKLTGIRGDFDTLITYVVATGGKKKQYTLYIADSDGMNEKVILRSNDPIMSPSWSPNGKRLAYVSFEKGRSIVYIQELRTGRRQILAQFKGINSAPRWSPDGKRIALSLSRDGNPEIYIIYINSGVKQRITRHYGIDTEPDWSPDGRKLVFTSDRGGRAQIYEIAVSERGRMGNPRRLTFEGNYNARASYSPDGKQIVYITRENGAYRVAVMELGSKSVNILTSSRLDESPDFSANGNSIIYATQVRGKGVLKVVPVYGGVSPQRLQVAYGDVREPSWSNFR